MPLTISGVDSPIHVVVDTGSSGSLRLSRQLVERLDLEPVGAEVYELGDGSLIRYNHSGK